MDTAGAEKFANRYLIQERVWSGTNGPMEIGSISTRGGGQASDWVVTAENVDVDYRGATNLHILNETTETLSRGTNVIYMGSVDLDGDGIQDGVVVSQLDSIEYRGRPYHVYNSYLLTSLTEGEDFLPFENHEVSQTSYTLANIEDLYLDEQIDGGVDDDYLSGTDAAELIFGHSGNDTLDGGNGNDTLYGGDGNDILLGQDGLDNIFGDAGNDRLFGGTGDDLLRGGINEDRLYGEEGDDVMYGDAGFDRLEGGAGEDELHGGAQADNLFGGIDNDTMYGDGGVDRLFGGAGDDLGFGGDGTDGMFGEQGNDTLYGGADNDRFFGGTGNDLIDGGADNDTIFAGAGFDTIIGGTGDDELSGNFNADTFVFSDGFGSDVITDFAATNNFEKIDLSGVTVIENLGDLFANHMGQVGSDVVIDDLAGNTITLLGVNLGDLDTNDFVF